MFMKMENLWIGRSEGKLHPVFVQLGESISLDIHLYEEDIKGSEVHAKMLHKIGILNKEELEAILGGLQIVRQEFREKKIAIAYELEDIHTHIENRLKEIIGPVAGKLHTARSRNDQIALDTHLYVKKLASEIAESLYRICSLLLSRSGEYLTEIFPSYTHLQVAQPVRFSHYLLSYFWMFLRDIERMIFVYEQADRLPLGSGAVAGVNYENDRIFLRDALGFQDIYENSMDAVSSRDHILNLLYAIAVLSLHISRLSEEFVIFSSVEFSFIELPDSITTGSSLMPQKKNPDLAELLRAKTGRFVANLHSLMMVLKGLPLAYNRDLQEDRKPLVESAEILTVLEGVYLLLSQFRLNKEKVLKSLHDGFSTATDLADALVEIHNIPFREAHHIAGRLVKLCVDNRYTLFTVPKELRKSIHPLLEDDTFYFHAISIENSIERKKSRGGTSLQRITEQMEIARQKLQEIKEKIPPKPDLEMSP